MKYMPCSKHLDQAFTLPGGSPTAAHCCFRPLVRDTATQVVVTPMELLIRRQCGRPGQLSFAEHRLLNTLPFTPLLHGAATQVVVTPMELLTRRPCPSTPQAQRSRPWRMGCWAVHRRQAGS